MKESTRLDWCFRRTIRSIASASTQRTWRGEWSVSKDEAAKGLKKADFDTYVKERVDHYVACKDADDLGMQDKVAVELLKKGANTTMQNIRRSLQNAAKKSSPRTPKTENEKMLGHLQAAWKVARNRDDAIVAEAQCEAVEICAQKCGLEIDKGDED